MKPYYQKNLHIETLRGIAIIFVVFGHIIGPGELAGLKVNKNSLLGYSYYCFEYLRMPLFTIISGFVYAYKPLTSKAFRFKFIKGKVRRLLIPMVIISSALFLSRVFIPGTNFNPSVGELPLIYVFPYDVYWYLYSLFLIFLLIVVIDTTAWFHRFRYWFMILVVSFLVCYIAGRYFAKAPNYFGFFGALYLLPFFILGIGFNRYWERIFTGKNLLVMLVVFALSFSAQQYIWFADDWERLSKQSILGLTVGTAGGFLLFNSKITNRFLAWVGSYAYPIFLFHVFFTGGVRIIFHRLGVFDYTVIISCTLVIATLLPIAMKRTLRKHKTSRLLLFGLRYNRVPNT